MLAIEFMHTIWKWLAVKEKLANTIFHVLTDKTISRMTDLAYTGLDIARIRKAITDKTWLTVMSCRRGLK